MEGLYESFKIYMIECVKVLIFELGTCILGLTLGQLQIDIQYIWFFSYSDDFNVIIDVNKSVE